MATREEEFTALSEQIVALQEEIQNWQAAGVPRKTLVVLLSHLTKVPQRTIKLVLGGIDDLYEEYFAGD